VSRDARVWVTDILEGCRRVAEYTAGMNIDAFRADQRTLDAVVRNLQIVGEAAKHLSDDVRALEPAIEWRKIAGLRDILVHAYFGVDDEIIWDVVQTKLPSLEAAAQRMLARMLAP